jgi:ABC-type glycerol-3-phosphate transport system permease component
MNKIWETKLQRLWLIVSAISVVLPLLLSLEAFATVNFANSMAVILAIMFIVSVPLSIFSIPFLALFRYGLELEPNALFAVTFYIVLLNIFGYVQWFWLMPKFFDRGKEYKLPTILNHN